MSITREPVAGSYSAWMRRSKSANSSWRTMASADWKFFDSLREARIAAGSGSPVW